MAEVWASIDLALPLAQVGENARRAEALGFDGVMVPDVMTDGFLAAQAAIGATRTIRVATSAVVAFARSPMVVAVAAWNLQALSGGRFHLGVGPLIRTNIVEKYGMPWSPPAPRMREYVESLRALFDCWQNGTKLDYRGEHYRFTRMQAFVAPPPIEHPEIPIHMAGIGPNMTAVAGELADALITHPSNVSARFLRERTRLWLARGAGRVGRDPKRTRLFVNPLVATGPDASTVAAERERQRGLLATLLSTPAYWPCVDLHGWHAVGEKLNGMVRAGRWDELGRELSDELVDTLMVAARHDELAAALRERYAEVADAYTLILPMTDRDDAALGRVVRSLRAA
ncbi:MAG: TIGR03617 family F420-dependent LLM class oxidoreductase [Myxococcota bacterium]